MQNHLAAAAQRTPMTSSAFFDPQGRVASLRQAQTALSEVAWTEQSPGPPVSPALPTLQSATADR